MSLLFLLRRSQQERAKKRLEFENQCNRIYNQLDFEKQRDTESTCANECLSLKFSSKQKKR